MGWGRCTIALLLALRVAVAGAAFGEVEEDPDAPPWQELELALPEFPRDQNLLPFYVSAGTTHQYFIDANSLAAGTDGVIRYALVVKTSGGSTNVTFEGIRCATLEYRIYATGRGDGTWVKSRARAEEWKRIEKKPVNGYHAALSRDYFCPDGFAIRDAEEGRKALKSSPRREATGF